jgi:hypothetical protein
VSIFKNIDFTDLIMIPNLVPCLLAMPLCLASVGCVTAQAEPPSAGRECSLRVVRQDTVRLGRDPAYVEPLVAEPDENGRVLLLGRFNYTFRPKPAGGYELASQAEPFGLVVTADGRMTAVPSPVPGKRVNSVRATALGRDGWSVVFGESTARAGESLNDTAAALWYGEYDGNRWSRLERLSTPDVTVIPSGASALTRMRGGLTWVVRAEGRRSSRLLFRQTNGRWTTELMHTSAAMVQPVFSRTGALRMAVVQADSTLRRDGNSLILRGPPHWGRIRVLHPGAQGRVYDLQRAVLNGTEVLSWSSPTPDRRWYITARIGFPEDSAPRLVLVDTAVSASDRNVEPFALENLGLIWALPSITGDGVRGVRFVSIGADGERRVLGVIPSPFKAPLFKAAALGREILVSGPIASDSGYGATLLLRLSVRCSARAIAP